MQASGQACSSRRRTCSGAAPSTFRGAYSAIAALEARLRQNGVVAYSSGNHAQAVAYAARLQGVSATIVMPKDAPEMKIAATRGYGAEIVFYDRYTEDREQISR